MEKLIVWLVVGGEFDDFRVFAICSSPQSALEIQTKFAATDPRSFGGGLIELRIAGPIECDIQIADPDDVLTGRPRKSPASQ
jgi:hypothetical protein